MAEAGMGRTERWQWRRAAEEIPDITSNRYLYEALAENKRRGQMMAIQARTISLLVIAVFLIYVNPKWSVLYYEAVILGFLLIGWAQAKAARVERSHLELGLILLDMLLMTIVIVVPNPLNDHVWSIAMQFKYGTFIYFFILLAGVTLAYSWRTLVPVTVFTVLVWLGAYFWARSQPDPIPEITENVRAVLFGQPDILALVDPGSILFESRLQEIIVFVLVAGMLALNGWRSNRLLIRQAEAARERANLSRHFPPNIVDGLAGLDNPFSLVREQPVAVLFADIVGFTKLAETTSADETVRLLREFHARMEACVFEYHGTLDKFLGDGLMATFGTPETTPEDALNALKSAAAMHRRIADWNAVRREEGKTPIRLSVGIHYGTVILGNIGSERRLEYAVLGDVVNVASRLESLTRVLDAETVVSADVVAAAGGEAIAAEFGFVENGLQAIRGREESVRSWLKPLAR
ncbi:adenylate/guanylate cyclase domain-containing protein [Sneathiella sp.]|uniref:adenylate/guanylate cyclase domain-containing protein n=1 Tax=Sneathiella sp. TaxID=1964365 RepID=UPI002FE17464